MEYNDRLFNLSKEACSMVESEKDNKDDEVKRKQDLLLKILLEKFREQLEERNVKKGILKIKFESKFYQESELGYREIKELVSSNNFDSFAREYCIYLGDVEPDSDEYGDAYYEIIWDYKTYFEQIEQMPIGKIDAVRKTFCQNNGHNFGDWEEGESKTLNEVMPFNYGDDSPCGTMRMEYEKVLYTFWSRKCLCCGYTERTEKKPKEVEAKEIKEKIKTLVNDLHRLSSEK